MNARRKLGIPIALIVVGTILTIASIAQGLTTIQGTLELGMALIGIGLPVLVFRLYREKHQSNLPYWLWLLVIGIAVLCIGSFHWIGTTIGACLMGAGTLTYVLVTRGPEAYDESESKKQLKKTIVISTGAIVVMVLLIIIGSSAGWSYGQERQASSASLDDELDSASLTSDSPTPTPTPEMGEIRWPNSNLVSWVPQPDHLHGVISIETSSWFNFTIDEVSAKEYSDYIDRCWNAGFTENYTRFDDWFDGTNSAGIELHASYEPDNETMTVDVSPHGDVFSKESVPRNENMPPSETPGTLAPPTIEPTAAEPSASGIAIPEASSAPPAPEPLSPLTQDDFLIGPYYDFDALAYVDENGRYIGVVMHPTAGDQPNDFETLRGIHFGDSQNDVESQYGTGEVVEIPDGVDPLDYFLLQEDYSNINDSDKYGKDGILKQLTYGLRYELPGWKVSITFYFTPEGTLGAVMYSE